MDRLLFVSLAGAVGSGCRYLVAISLPRLLGTSFPWGTLAVNLVGCFVIAVVGNLAPLTPTTKLILGTGFCGGFTTFSTYAMAWPLSMSSPRSSAASCSAPSAGSLPGRSSRTDCRVLFAQGGRNLLAHSLAIPRNHCRAALAGIL